MRKTAADNGKTRRKRTHVAVHSTFSTKAGNMFVVLHHRSATFA